jgi:hypothetical protein
MSEEEKQIAELSSLKKEMKPPPELEERVVSQLLKRSMIQRKSVFHIRNWIFTGAAAISIFALGFAAARVFHNSALPAQYTYILLLREDSNFLEKRTHEPSLVKEYAQWAREIAKSGTQITGEKLAGESRLLKISNGGVTQAQKSSKDPDGEVAGFFLLRAITENEALQKALTCPHLQHGGTIELRRID